MNKDFLKTVQIKNKLIVVFLFCITTISAEFSPQAKWIIPATNNSVQNQWLIFRKSYSIAEPLTEKLVAKISADSKYWLYINGELVVFEGQLKRGPTPTDTYYDEVDITKYVHKGSNTIALLLWFWGRDGYCHKNSGKAGLLFDASNSQVSWTSDKSWKCTPHTSFGVTGKPFPNYRLPEFNIHYTANPKNNDWMMPEYDENNFNESIEVGVAGCEPWNKLWKRPFPQWKNSGIVAYTNPLEMPFLTVGKPLKMKLPANYTVTPYFKIEVSDSGMLVDIRTENYKGGSEYNVRTEYITCKGIQQFETPGYMNGHEVIYSFPAGVKVLELGYRRTSFPTEHIGSFTCDDEVLNSLWQKSLNTMDVNMRDAIQDPDRERSQWWGDAVIILGEIFYTCDSNGVSAIKKAMSNLVEWQRADSSMYSPIPGGWGKELPQQTLASIGKYGFWNYYRYSGDSATIRYLYPHVKKYLGLWKTDSTGLVIHRLGKTVKQTNDLFWDWTDWGNNIDVPLCENAWYYMALESAANMSKLIGNKDESKQYQKQMQRLRTAYNKTYWTGKAYRSPAYKGQTDDRGNGLAVVAGLSDEKRWPSIRALFDTTFLAGPYLEKYILESYFAMNDAQAGIERMKKRYDQMIQSPVSTLWEGWKVGSGSYGGGSYNHGWSGGPLTLMSQYIAGVQPTNDGFSEVLIQPQMGNLKQVDCKVPHRLGLIIVKLIRVENNQLKAEITLPVGLKGKFLWNGKKVKLKQGKQEFQM
ncbi:MAG: alpha-L-rhamnosidase [Paludibacter sp.]|nr:alpha-L-rhamnosidase [Paludibacter sp.]